MSKKILVSSALLLCALVFTSGSFAFAETNATATGPLSSTPQMNSSMKDFLERYKVQLEALRAQKASTTAAFKTERKMLTASSTAKKNVDATCMQGLVETRETALGTSWSTLSTEISTALTARKTALSAAWALDGSERNSAIKSAWSAWKKAHREAFSKMRTARREAWDTFKKEARATCKTTVPREEALSSDGTDSLSL